jgi:hypothetical protein
MKENIVKKKNLSILFCMAVSFLLSLFLFPFTSLAADSSVCARVKIEIKQKLTLERQAFDAHMAINNGLTTITLENIKVDVTFADKDGNPVIASSDPNNTSALFFIRLDTLSNIANVTGTGTVAPATTADIHWLIIPAPGASNGLATGALYYVGATLTYTIGGQQNVTTVSPDYVYVKPMPELTLDYFLPTDIYGDDAFTSEIEPPVPFSLGVRVKNTGSGTASSMKIESAQPKITENDQGLLVGFNIESTEVKGKPVPNTLLADLGDIASHTSNAARWMMTCTLSGRFVEFTASFTHADELGGQLTSLMDAVNTHFLVHDVLVDVAGRDTIRDFLAKDGGVLRVYESEGLIDTEVTDQSASSTLSLQSGSTYMLSTPATAGFLYIKLADPYNSAKIIKEVIRSDGKRININNAWLSKTRNGSGPWQYSINFFDANNTGGNSYTVVFDDPAGVPRPPVLQFILDRTVAVGQQVSFLVQATDPDGTIPALSAAPLPALARFTDQGSGTGVFDWIPTTGQAGSYPITFTASDGVLKTSQRATITVTTSGNNPPLAPSSPSPADGVNNISVKARLAWTGGDPDQGDTVNYDVYLGASNPPVNKVATGQSGASYLTAMLAYGSAHYWKVVARDSFGAETTGPVWRFTTFFANDDADNDGLKNSKEIELGKDPFTPDNDRPIANAGPDMQGFTNQTVALDGSGSNDPESLPIAYQWSVVEVPQGSAVNISSLSNATSAGPSFIPDAAGTYRFSLTVNDGYQNSTPDEVIITVAKASPVANAGPDRNVIMGQAFMFDGSDSYSPDGILITYQWIFTEVPQGSVVTNASLSNPTSVRPLFTPDINGTYRLQLIVNDGELASAPDEVLINAMVSNVAPNADAGVDQNVLVGNVVHLNGGKSSDPDNGPQPLSYLWSFVTLPTGSVLTDSDITGRDTVNASLIPDIVGLYELRLTISDGGLSSDDTAQITAATSNVSPNANAGEDINLYLGQTVTLNGSASADPDNGPQPLAYLWRFVSIPARSSLANEAITGTTTASPSFIPDTAGVYVLRLTASDEEDIAFDNVAVTVIGNSITAAPGTGGTITPSGHVAVNYGANQTFTITPDAGYSTVDVLVDGVSVGVVTSYVFNNVTSDHTIEANFTGSRYTLTPTAGTGGAITPSGPVTANYGTSRTFTVTPDTGYQISDIRVDGVSVGAVTTYTFVDVISDHTIEAAFAINQYTLTPTAGTGGTITPSGPVTVNYGANQTFTITPDGGYSIVDVIVDGASAGAVASYTFSNITSSHTIEARFAINQYTLTAMAGANGIIIPSGTIAVNYGGNQTFAITPTAGYHVTDIRVDGESVGAVSSYTFSNITSSHTIEAAFAINQYTLTTTTGAGGTITPSSITVDHGASQTFTITPNTGSHVTDVRVDGESVGAVTTYLFSNVISNHTIVASFGTGTYSLDLPKTGQTTTYGGGDDGYYQAGVGWPTPRFTVNTDTTINDQLTGLVWPPDAGAPTFGLCAGGTKTWQGALDYVTCLNTNNYLGHNDWRLPNLNELESFTHAGIANTPAWLNSQGFSNVATGYYWSSTTLATAANVWVVSFQEGNMAYGAASDTASVWPVNGSTSGPALVWSTGQAESYAEGDDYDLGAGVELPDPRFTANANATITDNLTGLMWVADGSVTIYGSCAGGTKTWQGALDYVTCLNTNNYLGHNDWRLPNGKELRSLAHYGQTNMATWLNAAGFINVAAGPYWTSTTYAPSTGYAWAVDMVYGEMLAQTKMTGSHLIPVRAGTVTQVADITAPTTTASPAGGSYGSSKSVTLNCDDGMGSGCDRIYYTTDGTIPTTASSIYSFPITISTTTTLRFFAKDMAGNSEAVKSQTYTISTGNRVITVQFRDSNGNPLRGGVIRYYSGRWQTFGTTDATGRASKQLAVRTYTFAMTYAYSRQEKSQNVSTNPTVTFQTVRAVVQLRDSTGALIDTGTVQYYSGAWRNMGSTSGGQAFKELLPGTYRFRMTYAHSRQEKSQNISTNPTVVFATGCVHSGGKTCK